MHKFPDATNPKGKGTKKTIKHVFRLVSLSTAQIASPSYP